MKPPRFGIHPGRVLAGGYTVVANTPSQEA